MPTYVFKACECMPDEAFEMNVPIAERDEQVCPKGHAFARKVAFTGLTWAPTAGGMR